MEWIQSNGRQDKKTHARYGNDKYVILLLLFVFIFDFIFASWSQGLFVYTLHVISISTRCTSTPIASIDMSNE